MATNPSNATESACTRVGEGSSGHKARPKQKAQKNSRPKPVGKNGFLGCGWFLHIPVEGDKADLYVSAHPWSARGVWCGKMEKLATVNRIIYPVVEVAEAGICELHCENGRSYYLKTTSIAAEVDKPVRKIKTINLGKARKWWDDVDDQLKLLKSNIIAYAQTLDTNDNQVLEKFMTKCARKEANGEVPSAELLDPESRIFAAISFFSQREQLPKGVGELSTSSAGKKRNRQPSNIEGQENIRNQIIPLSEDDITTQSQLHPQPKRNKLAKAEKKCIFPSQREIDAGFIFGRSFKFEVSMNKVRPPSFETTNQRVLNEENARKVYSKLRTGEITDAAWLTLRPVLITPPTRSSNSDGSTLMFKEGQSKSTFLTAMNAMPGETDEEKRDAMLPYVTWEPVDGQHILHACNVLAMGDLEGGQLSQVEYDSIFAKRPATVVAYDDEACYGAQSLKLNDFNTDRVHHTTMIEMLTKGRKVWQSFNCPFKGNKSVDDQMNFLRCLPSITKETPPEHKDTVKLIKEFYKNYLHPIMLDDEPWEALRKMCEAYEKGWTFYAKSSKIDEQVKGKPRKKMVIGWLKPVQATSTADFEFLCSAATVDEPHEVQRLYFEGHSRSAKDAIPDTLCSMAHLAKQRVSVQNALRWLHINASDGSAKMGWLTQDVMRYGEREVLNALAKEGSQEFHEKWSFIPSNTGYDTMRSREYLIPLVLKAHFQNVRNGGLGLYNATGQLIQRDVTGNWTMDFQHAGSRGFGIDTYVKVSKSIFDADGGVKMAKNTCWVFECRGHGRSNIWGEEEYTSIWQKITQSMEGVERWNMVLLLPAGVDAINVLEFLQLPLDTTHVLHLSYVFGPQCKERGQQLKVHGRVIAEVKPTGAIIVILRHPANSTLDGNITADHETIDPICSEPDRWDVCTKYNEARNPQCIDDLIKPFYEANSWTIAVQGYSHMIDTLAGKTHELIIMESDPGMLTWLQEWKHSVVDKEATTRFELWEDEDELEEHAHEAEAARTAHLFQDSQPNSGFSSGRRHLQVGSEATTTHGMGSTDSGTTIVPNTEVQGQQDPFYMPGLTESEA